MRRLAMLGVVALSGCTAAPTGTAAREWRGAERKAMAGRVREEFRHAWEGYKRYAWGHDELKPLSREAHDWYSRPLLITPVDALDTLLLLGDREEAERTRAYIVENLSFDKDISVKNFEITIRVLGGLLSASQMMSDPRLLALADDLGRRLLPVFDSPTGMPYVYVNLKTGETSGAESNPAEIGTLLLEFGTLARLTGKSVYYDKAKHALTRLFERRSPIGLVGEVIDVESGRWVSPSSHVGARIDSYYEYLLKCWRLFDDEECGRMWRESIAALNRHVADETPTGLWYGPVDMTSGRRTAREFGALEAFFPAVLALAGDLDRARRLQDSAFSMWSAAGVEPDGFDYVAMRATHPAYPLRPEIVESAWSLHRATGDPRYLDMGRVFFDAIVTHCRTEAGYAVLEDVNTKRQGDLMPSYFLAETLKYFHLLFAPQDDIDPEKVVFTTEAHPLRRTW
ncbi:MAG TPA: glycoside hydrolase family 47 protein [Candidatus Polarisedimenticolia bacterium]|jgi:mannosidase alpha-like ER degradation enhancer 2|nr:glycoside hydrolase family 47 protein [Candidatus Polarisedimenticolia bacterium]